MRHKLRERYSGITQDQNFNYEGLIFVDCTFEKVTSEGAEIDSDFVRCTFDNVDWYWCIGQSCVFIECEFKDCDLRGSFHSTSFIACKFIHCKTGSDALGGTTEWEDCVAIECTFAKTVLPPGTKLL